VSAQSARILPRPEVAISGSVLVLIQFDVCEELRLDQLQQTAHARTQPQPRLKPPVPAYVRYERPPVIEPLEPITLASGERLDGEIKYYDYGVVSVIFHFAFTGDWNSLLQLSSRWVWDADFASRAEPIVRQKLERSKSAMVKPYARWLSEDYFIFHVRADDEQLAAELTRKHGTKIAQIVRGDREPLSTGECVEVLQSRISYYENDVSVIGWNAAFVYDTNPGAETAIQLLEYANSQLLEFRHYDELLTGILSGVYETLERKQGVLSRWRMARRATRLHRVLLEIGELTERADNTIKFVSDMFAARLYRVAAARVGVPDYRNLVAQKLRTAEELYHYMIEQFNQSRGFFLEALVVLILLIELVFLFRGHGS
jgi:hypothetical protein